MTRAFAALLLVSPLALATVGCAGSEALPFDSGQPATGGGAGTTATGGAAGIAGTGATDGGPGAKQLPSCLRDLFSACPLDGPCQVDIGTGNTCYQSGVKVSGATGDFCPNDGGTGAYRGVFKADGTLCYSSQTVQLPNEYCEVNHTTWRNAAGDVVASGIATSLEPSPDGYYSALSFTCAASGETVSFRCGVNDPCQTDPACTTGTCP